MFGLDRPAGLRPGIRYPAWAPGAGGGLRPASPAKALGRGGADGGRDAEDPPPPFIIS